MNLVVHTEPLLSKSHCTQAIICSKTTELWGNRKPPCGSALFYTKKWQRIHTVPPHPANLVNRVSLNPLPPLRKPGFWFKPRNQVTAASQQKASRKRVAHVFQKSPDGSRHAMTLLSPQHSRSLFSSIQFYFCSTSLSQLQVSLEIIYFPIVFTCWTMYTCTCS